MTTARPPMADHISDAICRMLRADVPDRSIIDWLGKMVTEILYAVEDGNMQCIRALFENVDTLIVDANRSSTPATPCFSDTIH